MSTFSDLVEFCGTSCDAARRDHDHCSRHGIRSAAARRAWTASSGAACRTPCRHGTACAATRSARSIPSCVSRRQIVIRGCGFGPWAGTDRVPRARRPRSRRSSVAPESWCDDEIRGPCARRRWLRPGHPAHRRDRPPSATASSRSVASVVPRRRSRARSGDHPLQHGSRDGQTASAWTGRTAADRVADVRGRRVTSGDHRRGQRRADRRLRPGARRRPLELHRHGLHLDSARAGADHRRRGVRVAAGKAATLVRLPGPAGADGEWHRGDPGDPVLPRRPAPDRPGRPRAGQQPAPRHQQDRVGPGLPSQRTGARPSTTGSWPASRHAARRATGRRRVEPVADDRLAERRRRRRGHASRATTPSAATSTHRSTSSCRRT